MPTGQATILPPTSLCEDTRRLLTLYSMPWAPTIGQVCPATLRSQGSQCFRPLWMLHCTQEWVTCLQVTWNNRVRGSAKSMELCAQRPESLQARGPSLEICTPAQLLGSHRHCPGPEAGSAWKYTRLPAIHSLSCFSEKWDHVTCLTCSGYCPIQRP